MVSIPENFYHRCRNVLLQCSEFDSNDSLRSIFVTDKLNPFRDSLPEATSKNDRVAFCLDYLRQKRSSKGEQILLIFLEVLRNRQADELREELEELCSLVEQEFNQEFNNENEIAVPFVIVAMTRDEATNLIEGNILNNNGVAPIERQRFHQIKGELAANGIADLLSHYGEDRENWKPYIEQTENEQYTIKNIVSKITKRINEDEERQNLRRRLKAKFYSAAFFESDTNRRIKTWEELEQAGCILIVDAISLFHPLLRNSLLQSNLSGAKNVPMLVRSPINCSAIPANQLIEQQISLEMQRAFARFDKHLDWLCEFDVGNMRTLQRRLFAILDKGIDSFKGKQPHPDNPNRMRETIGEAKGYNKVLFGSYRK